ncbi:calcium and integrin-binding protein 1-like [Anthonomus grandis grandis]|uniref:calcium and integrin-binding protein 1-like n=1 Tax=Anthonomus grandis grandis TaxID=2921223 RepID=UPI00216510E2|nr:calcium and integrin-binding protein 1-like [Anthonomus grandis grandis]
MGGSKSRLSALTQDILEEYTILTYLNKSEILHIFKIFGQMDRDGTGLQDCDARFPSESVQEIFTQLKFNPFRDRIFKVFSSRGDNCMSFEDVLDLCSVMSEKCPDNVKAAWAFRILDFDEDGLIGEEDLARVIDRLTQHSGYLTEEEQQHIIKILMEGLDIESSGKVSVQEFVHSVGKMSEFPHSFCFRL